MWSAGLVLIDALILAPGDRDKAKALTGKNDVHQYVLNRKLEKKMSKLYVSDRTNLWAACFAPAPERPNATQLFDYLLTEL